ncbi:MAG TPA: FAD-dependent oxidoreductase [Thermoleophilaceae bacterium]|jgi:succinate dehydrogenase/fumarate reductase flavoprotein subunit|nr:FAD-dependent oxidoreductase [Thermoleophilaceae bacterium]
MPDLVVAGAGMAGLAAAARARELGASVELYEKGDRAGGSMLLSSGFVWRHRAFDDFRRECPGGDPALQRAVYERLDEALEWLESLGAPVTERETGNPLTRGRRFDVASLTGTLMDAAGGVRLAEPLRELPSGVPIVLATGGFQGDRSLVREHVTPEADHLLLRANPWSSGDGMRMGLGAGAELSAGMDEFYGRNMPAPPAVIREQDFVPLAQLYARHADVQDAKGEHFRTRAWSEIDVVQWTAQRPGARARYLVPDEALTVRVRERTVADMIEAARGAGAAVSRGDGVTCVEVVAAITTTLGGLRIDESARVADGVFAAGTDAGGISTGGYSSGLAAALVFGRIAAEAALA